MIAIQDRQKDVLPRGVVQVLEVGHGHLTQAVRAGGERRDFPQPKPDDVATVAVSFESAPVDEPLGQPPSGAQRNAAAATEIRQREPGMARVERRQQPQRSIHHGIAMRRTLAAQPGCGHAAELSGRSAIEWHHAGEGFPVVIDSGAGPTEE